MSDNQTASPPPPGRLWQDTHTCKSNEVPRNSYWYTTRGNNQIKSSISLKFVTAAPPIASKLRRQRQPNEMSCTVHTQVTKWGRHFFRGFVYSARFKSPSSWPVRSRKGSLAPLRPQLLTLLARACIALSYGFRQHSSLANFRRIFLVGG